MEPFTPNDPLWKLMSKARPVVERPDFTQKVVRAARQEAQETGWWCRMRGWIGEWQRPLMAAAAATAAVIAISMAWGQHGGETSSPAVAVSAPVAQVEEAGMADIAEMEDEDFSIPLDSLDHMDALVAREDTSSLTDAEIQFLLY